jgi:predicted MFS family arabinose efflux permease
LLGVLDWRGIFLALSALTVAVAALILFVVPDRRVTEGVSTDLRGQLRDLGYIYTHGYFWRLTVMISAGAAVFLSYQTLWAAPWLRDVAGYDRIAVADSLLLFNVGMLVGVLSLGAIAQRLQRIGVPIVATVAGSFSVMMLVQVAMALELTGIARLLCFLFGFFGSSTILAYAVYPRIFPAALIGRVNTAQNMSIFIVAFAVQWAIGAIIGLWPQAAEGHYAPEGHRAALIVLIACEALAFAWFAWPRRK